MLARANKASVKSYRRRRPGCQGRRQQRPSAQHPTDADVRVGPWPTSPARRQREGRSEAASPRGYGMLAGTSPIIRSSRSIVRD